jgi:hypothetical protein
LRLHQAVENHRGRDRIREGAVGSIRLNPQPARQPPQRVSPPPKAPPGDADRVQDVPATSQRFMHALPAMPELGLEKSQIKANVVPDHHRPTEQLNHPRKHISETGLPIDHLLSDARQPGDVKPDPALRIDKLLICSDALAALDAQDADLGDAVPIPRTRTGRLHIDKRQWNIKELVEKGRHVAFGFERNGFDPARGTGRRPVFSMKARAGSPCHTVLLSLSKSFMLD